MAAKRKIQVTLRGQKFEAGRAEIYDLLDSVDPSQLVPNRGKASAYFIIVGDKKLPVKQALKVVLDAKGLDLTILDVTTKDAVNIFRRLGFPIVVERGSKGSKAAIMKHVGTLNFPGSSVDDKRRLYDTA